MATAESGAGAGSSNTTPTNFTATTGKEKEGESKGMAAAPSGSQKQPSGPLAMTTHDGSVVSDSLTALSKTVLTSIASLSDLPLSEETKRLLPGLEGLLRESLVGVLGETNIHVDDDTISSSVSLVAESMTTKGRCYHALQHIFDISEHMKDPMAKLAAVWHDVVYYSIDKGFLPKQEALLKGVLEADDAANRLVLCGPLEDPLMELVANMYGFIPGEPLPALGTNEFLSALIGVRAMSAILPVQQLLELAACIESTIPFRGVNELGEKPTDRLFNRLLPISRALNLPDQWAISAVHKAVETANNDLGSFDSTDRDYFIDATWKLIPEGRPQLALDENCPLTEFYSEMQGLQGRCVRMPVAVIFQSFRNVPSAEELDDKRKRTWDNLGIVKQYGQVRLLQVKILLTMMAVIGADPSTLLLRPCLKLQVPYAERAAAELTGREREIRRWLAPGRRIGFDWDPACSPVGTLLFDSLGFEGIAAALESAESGAPSDSVSESESNHFSLLSHVPQSTLDAIAEALAELVPFHAEELRKLPSRVHDKAS